MNISVFSAFGKDKVNLLFETTSEDITSKPPSFPKSMVFVNALGDQPREMSLPAPALGPNQHVLVRGELSSFDFDDTVYHMPPSGFVRGELIFRDQ